MPQSKEEIAATIPEFRDYDDESEGAFKSAIGKTIAEVRIHDNELRLRLTDGSTLVMYDNGQSCCERRYMRTDDPLSDYAGATLVGGEIRTVPRMKDGEDCNYNVHEIQFLAIRTSKGEFVCSNHNEHNGYYGGFSLTCKATS